jgi:PKD repeat protein
MSFAADDTTVCDTQTVSLTGSSAGDVTPNTWAWFDNEVIFATTANTTRIFAAGTHNVEYYGCNGAACTDYENKTAYIHSDQHQTVGFIANGTTKYEGDCFFLADTTTGDRDSYKWLINNVSNGTTEDLVFCCPTNGTYDVQHAVSNAGCGEAWHNETSYLTCLPPPTPTPTPAPTPLPYGNFRYDSLYVNGLNNNSQIRRAVDMVYQRGGTYQVNIHGTGLFPNMQLIVKNKSAY